MFVKHNYCILMIGRCKKSTKYEVTETVGARDTSYFVVRTSYFPHPPPGDEIPYPFGGRGCTGVEAVAAG